MNHQQPARTSLKTWFKSHSRFGLLGLFFLIIIYWFSLPYPLFQDPISPVLVDRHNNLLGARIAKDGQWRFPPNDSIPTKFIAAITEFEDHRFFYHPGIDPIGIGRAVVQNIRSGKVVSGGSTLTMQVIRLAQKTKSRSLWQKLKETILATRLELSYSKNEILNLYAAHAPFGGNVVGLDAAAWRYYAKRADLLSWGEVTTLAVLPNAPALIHPGRNRDALFAKRNRLLDRLYASGKLDSLTCALAKEEPLPAKPLPLPQLAPHLLDRWNTDIPVCENTVFTTQTGIPVLQSSIDRNLQHQITQVLQRQLRNLKDNDIHNAAALVLDVERNEVVAYIGNVIGTGAEHGEQVDVIKAARSTGSILKPILYALTLQEGLITPETLLPDIPTTLSGYRPENYHEKFDGVVSAKRALTRSLNVPMVYLLQRYGLEKFHHELQQLQFSTINQPPSHYGLPLVLGGAEATLWDITNTYSGMARTLNHFQPNNGQYDAGDWQQATYYINNCSKNSTLQNTPTRLNAAAIYQTFQAMQELERPNSEGEWRRFRNRDGIAWKTGTSFGFRDAWAVGVNARFVVGVWAGNADGEGRPGLVGVKAAAPILFDIFQLLPYAEPFQPPYDEMVELSICKNSGLRPSELCPIDTIWAAISGQKVGLCPYHQRIHLDASGQFQVHADCENPQQMQQQARFVLPPIEAFYYQSKNPTYEPLPPYRTDCQSSLTTDNQTMQLIYPKYPAQIYVPIDLDGQRSRTVFKVAHQQPAATIFWHLDNEYLGETQHFHEMELQPSAGKHQLTLVDEQGNRVAQEFTIVE